MKIYKIAQITPTNKMTDPKETEKQQVFQESLGMIQNASAMVNKSIQTLQTNQTETLFTKEGFINAIQNGDIRKININKVNDSIKAMQAISQSALAINEAIREVENVGGDVNSINGMIVQAILSGNYSSFTQSLPGFQQNLGAQTGTTSHSVTETAY